MKRLINRLPIAFLLIATTGFLACKQTVRTSHDVLYLASGEEVTGNLESITQDSLLFTTKDTKLALPIKEIRSIDLPAPRDGENWQTYKDIDDPVLKDILSNTKVPPTDAKYINLYVEHNFILKKDGSFEKSTRIIRLVTAESGKGLAANNTWNYLADRAYAKLDFARSISPDGKVTHIREAAINRTSRYPAPSEYSNEMQLQIAVPESRLGSILDFKFSTVQNTVDSIHPIAEEIILSDNQPTLTEIIKVTKPSNTPLAVYVSSDKIPSPRKETKQGMETTIWTIKDRPPLRAERQTPPKADYLPRFIIAAKQDWHKIASIMRNSLPENTSKLLTTTVDSLVSNLKSNQEKAKALYNFVATTIRAAGPVYPKFSYIPTPANIVLKRKFANNLDRAWLLYSMMQQAGLESDLILIRTRNTGKLIPTFPCLEQLNHALVLFQDNIYLDPRPNVTFATLLEQDAMGLSITTGKLKKTPLNPASKEATITKMNAKLLNNGSLKLTVTVKFNGKNSVEWKSYLKTLSPPELKQEAEDLATTIHPNAILKSFKFKGIEPLNSNISYALTLVIPNYAIKAGKYLIFNLPGVKHSAFLAGATERIYPIDREIRRSKILSLTIKFPPASRLIYYPKDISVKNKYDSYTASFQHPTQTTLQFNESFKTETPLIPSQDYSQYQKIVTSMARLSQKPIVLKIK